METINDILYFCNDAIFYDYTNVGTTCELNQVRKCIFNSFYKRIPHSKILVRLSIIDNIILKMHGNEIENFHESIDDLRENIVVVRV